LFLTPTSSVYECVQIAIDLKKNTTKKSSYKDYLSKFKHFELFLKESKIEDLPIKDFNANHASAYLFRIKTSKSNRGVPLSNITKNNYIRFIRNVFNVLIKDLRVIENNPFEGVQKLHTTKIIPKCYNEHTKNLILEYLYANDRRLYFVCCFLYYGFIRPNELCHVQIGDINLKKRLLILPKHATKTNYERIVRISDPLMNIVLDMHLDLHPKKAYLFGKSLDTCVDKIPRADYISKRWASRREKMNIPSRHKLYHFKHTGIQDHSAAGISIAQISRQSGLTLEVLQEYLENKSFPAEEEFLHGAPWLGTMERCLSPTIRVEKLFKQFNTLSDTQKDLFLQRIAV